MPLEASWVPGHVGQPQFIDSLATVDGRHMTDVVGYREGNRVTWVLKGEFENTFHFPIPTPVIDDGIRARIERVFVLFELGPQAFLGGVSVFDGPNRIAQHPGRDDITGDHSRRLDAQNSWPVPNRPEVFFGICISVTVRASLDELVRFTSAGVDFATTV